MAKKSPSTFTRKESITGRLRVHPRGFGFVSWTDEASGTPSSAFLAPKEVARFLDGDILEVSIAQDKDDRLNASEPKLVERMRKELFGEVARRGKKLVLRPDPEVGSAELPLNRGKLAVQEGDVVVARFEAETLTPMRKVEDSVEQGLTRVILRHGLREEVTGPVRAAVLKATKRKHNGTGRRDLRELPTVTIDGPSTRDIDDAICVLPADKDGALRLLVSISDVAAFVDEGSALDLEARQRATSVYLEGRVLPMLPEELSAAWLSLLPGEDRQCLTVELRLDPEGNVLSVDLYESLIRSAARLTYDDAAEYLDRGEVRPSLEPVRAMLPWLRAVDARLAVSREHRGGVLLERDEARVTFDARTGRPSGLGTVPLTTAHALIERCMVVANTAVARWLVERGVPAPFRIHEPPAPERVADLEIFAAQFDLAAGFGPALSPRALAAFDRQIRGKDGEAALRSVMRRLLGPARYTSAHGLHFGLAAPLYLHFTSPIRRYADLLVHRAVKQYLKGRRDFVPGDPQVEQDCSAINERASLASKAENDRLRAVQAEVLSEHTGREYRGRVTRIRPFGLIVQLDGFGAEGIVPLESLPHGPYKVEPRETRLIGNRRTYTLGMPLKVRVVATDQALGRVELALVMA
ncbi:MAG: VacB/RNase II family 3'-5' exoribonuclease [Myxococcota bacterium]|jgi:ribonuclease R|nr:VacB/RNase II family 3'-5' exoribonuclease [Myxococcota bacterium]